MDELKRYARRIIRTRNDFIKGFYYFAKYGVSEDLATVISNGKILINNQADRVSAEKREAPMRKVFPGDYSEEETKESEVLEFGGFYLDVIQLDKNPKKREVLQAYRAGVENAQDISDRVNSVNDLESLKKLSLEVTEWRYAFIKGFEHFAGSRVSQDLGVVVGNLASTLHDKAAIVKHDGLGSSWR
jgi:hypothetical protein